VIGAELYDRKPPYHPSQDSIVRTEARRLRSKLKEYYESEGSADPVLIYFRPGSYVPVFRLREGLTREAPAPKAVDGSLRQTAQLSNFDDLQRRIACPDGVVSRWKVPRSTWTESR
jgi:hypothetical protein